MKSTVEFGRAVAELDYGCDCREALRERPASSVHCVVTSPPYWGLRDYGTGDAQIGIEATPDAYVDQIVDVFREVWRVLRDDGTLWLNLGDSYTSGGPDSRAPDNKDTKGGRTNEDWRPSQPPGLKPKDFWRPMCRFL